MKRHTRCTLAAVLLTSSLAWAGEARTHDGFFLRMQTGLGYTSASTSNLTLAGGSGALNVEIGGTVAKSLMLYGKLFGTVTVNPRAYVGGVQVTSLGDQTAGHLGTVGIGVTYYFMPINLYLSGAVSFAQLGLSQNGQSLVQTGVGGAAHFGIGKEWWVGPNWGLGLGAELVGVVVDDTQGTSWRGSTFVLMFSATFS